MSNNWSELLQLIGYAFEAHGTRARTPLKAFRKWDQKTPFGVHPTWCAMTLLTEITLPEDLRWIGAQALLLHDLLENTTAGFPPCVSNRVRSLVEEMTFYGGIELEMSEIWSRSKECRLLKLYDTTSNLLDRFPQPPEKFACYIGYAKTLLLYVEKDFGDLNIIRLARAACR